MSNYTIWGLFGPATWPWWLTGLAFFCSWNPQLHARWGQRFLASALAILLLFAVLPLGFWLGEPLEQRFPKLTTRGHHIDHIVVLAGAERLAASARSGRPEVGGAAERVTEAAHLARIHPSADVWIVGGVRYPRSARADIDWTALAWRRLGIAPGRIHTVDGTLNTCANAEGIAARRLSGSILLITSALHMPRAVGCFKASGVDVMPYPVDYQNEFISDGGRMPSTNLIANLQRTDSALHEWLGLALYRLQGRTTALFPR